MPSKVASLPSIVDMGLFFFWVGLLGLYFLDSTCLGFFIMGRLGRATISLGSPIWSRFIFWTQFFLIVPYSGGDVPYLGVFVP